MNNIALKSLLLILLMNHQSIGWSTSANPLIESGNLKSDFKLPDHHWKTLSSKDLKGKHEIFDMKQGKEYVFLYRMSPGAEIGVKEHDRWEDVTIINGTLEWLDFNGHTQQILGTGATVDRPPHIKHGPFRAGKNGCLMYVRMHG